MFMGKRIALTLLAMVLLVFAAGCSKEETDDGTVHSGEFKVEMKTLKYVPAKFTVKVGTKVTFQNRDGMAHDVVQVEVKDLGKVEPGFNSGVIEPGKSWTITLDKPGEYPILCTQFGHFTAGMIGTIRVVE